MNTTESDVHVFRLVDRVGICCITSDGNTWHVIDGLSEVGVFHSLAAAQFRARRVTGESRDGNFVL